jgi:hypothetical protein
MAASIAAIWGSFSSDRLALSALYRDGGSKCRGVAETDEEGAEQIGQVGLF